MAAFDIHRAKREIDKASLTRQGRAAFECIIEKHWKEFHKMKPTERKATLVRMGAPLTYDQLVRNIISKELYKRGKKK